MNIKLPQRLTDAIKAYQEECDKRDERKAGVRDRNSQLEADLAQARADLDAATDAALDNPSPENDQKEMELRRKVADLTLQVSGAGHRESRVQFNPKIRELAEAAIEIGREEARKYYEQNHEAAAQKIAEAKYAYLLALVEYRRLMNTAYGIYGASVRQTNESMDDPAKRPYFGEISPFYTSGSKPPYGIFETEVLHALKYGRIERSSCGKEREVAE